MWEPGVGAAQALANMGSGEVEGQKWMPSLELLVTKVSLTRPGFLDPAPPCCAGQTPQVKDRLATFPGHLAQGLVSDQSSNRPANGRRTRRDQKVIWAGTAPDTRFQEATGESV